MLSCKIIIINFQLYKYLNWISLGSMGVYILSRERNQLPCSRSQYETGKIQVLKEKFRRCSFRPEIEDFKNSLKINVLVQICQILTYLF